MTQSEFPSKADILKKRATEYTIVCGESMHIMIFEVQSHIDAGWKLQGGVSSAITRNGFHYFYQAMIKKV